jgi:hypothetical protein
MAIDAKYTVELTAQTTQFVAAMGRASASAQAAANKVTRAFSGVQGAAAALGASLSVAGFALMIKRSIDAADRLNDLSKATGVAVETLGGIGFAAQQSGLDLDGVAKAFGKLNLQIASATAGNQEAAHAFEVIGISVDELKRSSPDQVLARIADKFASYEDGANKAALGQAFFKREYQAIIPLLDEGGDKLRKNIDYYRQYSRVTDDVAKRSDEFNDTMVKLRLLSGAFSKTLTAELLPGMQGLADAFLAAKEKGTGFSTWASDTADVIKGIAKAAIIATTEVSSLGHVLGARAAQVEALTRFDIAGLRLIGDEAEKDQKDRYARMQKLLDAINNPKPSAAAAAFAARPPQRPAPSLGGATDAAGASMHKALETALATLRADTEAEKAVWENRAKSLEAMYERSGISLTDFFSEKQKAQNEDLARTTENYLAEIALIDDFIAHASTAADKFSGEKDRFAAAAKQRQAIITAAGRAQELLDQQPIATEAKSLAAFETSAAAVANQIERINLLQQAGSISELEALSRSGDAIRAKIGLLGAEADAFAILAKRSAEIDPQAAQAAQNQVDALRLRMQALGVQADALNRKFSETFSGPFADALVAAADGTKSLKDAFKDMTRSIVHNLNEIAAKELATKLFGGGGYLGSGGMDIGAILAKLFGGMTAGAGAGWVSGFDLGGLASGTSFARGGPTLVGERGPEIVNLPRGAEVIPNNVIGRQGERSMVVHQNFAIDGPVDRRTKNQIAAAALDGLRRAARSIR